MLNPAKLETIRIEGQELSSITDIKTLIRRVLTLHQYKIDLENLIFHMELLDAFEDLYHHML